VKYTINGKHNFEFEVKAKVIPVKVEFEQKELRFKFTDDSIKMETSQTLKI